MLPEAALHFKEVTVHPPRCMPLSAHSLCSKKEPALSYACLSCSRVWVGAFSWLTVTGVWKGWWSSGKTLDCYLAGVSSNPGSGTLKF